MSLIIHKYVIILFMKKILIGIVLAVALLIFTKTSANAGYVNGYYRSNGAYVQGYWRTEPNYYKWDNYSFNGDWSDSYNDKSWYRDYGYDPEPWDNEYPNYDYWDSSYDYYDDSYDYYDSYDYDSYDYWDY